MSPKPRSEQKNMNDPRGPFGLFLRHWVDSRLGGDESKLAKELGMSDRTIRKWMEGEHGPAFQDLDRVARAMGYADWSGLAAACTRFNGKQA